MTVKDLIEKLSVMPPDAQVVIAMFSECIDLDDDYPVLLKLIERRGVYLSWEKNEKNWDHAKDGEPQPFDACYFPGN